MWLFADLIAIFEARNVLWGFFLFLLILFSMSNKNGEALGSRILIFFYSNHFAEEPDK